MDFVAEKKINPDIKRAIGIMSGKSGGGISTVVMLLAQIDSQSSCESCVSAPANG